MASAHMTAEVPGRKTVTEKAADDLALYWIRCCDEFMDRQRKEIIEREPSRQELDSHIDALKFMIRATLSVQALCADPDFPVRQLSSRIASKLLQLEESLKMLQNPMTDAEADAVLDQAFPDGSRT